MKIEAGCESLVERGECPDCGAHLFLAGPEGGLTQNIKCAACGSEFNFCPKCPAIPMGYVERI